MIDPAKPETVAMAISMLMGSIMSVQLRDGDKVLPASLAMLERVQGIRDGELKKAFAQLKRLSEVERRTVAALATAITDSILQPVLDHLGENDSTDRERELCELFGLRWVADH